MLTVTVAVLIVIQLITNFELFSQLIVNFHFIACTDNNFYHALNTCKFWL